MHDLVIRGGTVVDGTGDAPRTADVAVADGVIVEQVHDLPADAARLVQRSEGYVETIVRGETVVDHGELTDARPGALVRGPRS